MTKFFFRTAVFGGLALSSFGQYKAINPKVAQIVSEVSEERITATLKQVGRLRDPKHSFVAGQPDAGSRGGA